MIIAIKRNCLKGLLGVHEYQAIQTPFMQYSKSSIRR